MKFSRRKLVIAASAAPMLLGASPAATNAAAQTPAPPATALPDKSSFAALDMTYLDSGSQHPVSLGAAQAIDTYLAKRKLDPAAQAYELPEDDVRAKFARLINAEPDEIAYVQSTTAAEQMVHRGLGLPANGAHVVTDTLHFFGSIPIYEELKRQGCEVTWVRARDGRIRVDDMRAAIRPGTRLVAVSLVSTINGFEHDLKAVCDIAHANGALVYADIIHAAGAVPVDVKASGVDFAACASYKWLMGDFGLGFLYARKDVQSQLRRTECSYYGIDSFSSHIYPLDPPGEQAADYSFADSAEGRFAHGTIGHMVIAQLGYSLDYISNLTVASIQAHAQTLVGHLKEELPHRGFNVITPPEAHTPHVAIALANASQLLRDRMNAGKVHITLSRNRFRLTPSVFNDHADIERFLTVLGRA